MKSNQELTGRRGVERRLFGLVVVCLTLATGFSAGAVVAQDAPIRIAVVDLEYVVAQSPAGVALQQQLATFTESINAEVKSKRDAANAIRQRAAEGANSLSPERLTQLQQEFEDAQIAIKRYQDDKQREGQKMQAEGLRAVEQQLQPVFEQVRDERGYDLILNNVPGVIVMAGPRVDITQVVLDKLKAASASGG